MVLVSFTFNSFQPYQAQPIPLPGSRVITQQAKLKLTELGGGDPYEQFGQAVALSEDGNTAVSTTAPYFQLPNQALYHNAAYVHVRDGTTWTQQARLFPDDAALDDFFGLDVDMSADGNTIILGSFSHDHNGVAATGAAYIFVRSGTTWTQQAELQPTDSITDLRFGFSVSLSDDGNTALVLAAGTHNDVLIEPAAAYVFVRSGSTWSQQSELSFADLANTVLGTNSKSAALSGAGDTALVSVSVAPDSEPVVFVFTRSGGVWTEQTRLLPPDADNSDGFGSTVTLSDNGDFALIGVPYYDAPGIFGAGAADFFSRSGGIWTHQGTLTASDAAISERFGESVSLSSDGATALITAPDKPCCTFNGAAYIFTRSGNSWTELTKFVPADNQENDHFGNDGALSGDGNTALVGDYQEDNINGLEAGASYVFIDNGVTWVEQAKLIATHFPLEGERTDNFGYQVALSGDGNTTLVFATDFDETGAGIGVARVYARNGASWSLQSELYKTDTVTSTPFGPFVSLSADGNTALVGLYVFVRSGTTWSFQQKLLLFPTILASVDLSDDGNTAIIGDVSFEFGSAWVYTRTGSTWSNAIYVEGSSMEEDDGYGNSVALSGDGNYAIVGANLNGSAGKAFVFSRSGNIWTEQSILNPSAGAGSNFGFNVALNGDGSTAALGSFMGSPSGNSGVVSIFTRDTTTWTEQTHFTAGGGYYTLPIELSANGNQVLIGKPNTISSTNFPIDPGPSGAFLYQRDGTTWSQSAFIVPADAQPYDYVGSDVSISADGLTLLVGAMGDDTDEVSNSGDYFDNAGAAYVLFEDGTIATATPTATDTATETPAMTETPVSGTPTATAIPGDELLTNGGFEIDTDTDKVPDGWSQKHPTKDKLKCNKPEKEVAHTGECAYMFKGGAGENSKLVQKPTLTGLTFMFGDTLDLSLFLNASNAATNGKIKVRVGYSDSTATGKITEDLTQTGGYTEITGGYMIESGAVQKIKVQLEHKSAAGKLFIDDVTLILQAGGVSRLIVLPGN
ncbi:MAG: FG-GAP repeat protein [Anaerolineae bacterium]|nr:FG-GAP repeat protein [Anaerolineae bacterium]